MRVWFDTEFTSLEEHAAELLSAGLAAESGDECYVERIDNGLLSHSTEFVVENVIPLFGLVPGARVNTYGEFADRITDYLLGLGEPVDLICDYHLDRDLMQHVLEHGTRWEDVIGLIRWEYAPGEAFYTNVGQDAFDASFAEADAAGLARHHALADARALRAACLAVEADE